MCKYLDAVSQTFWTPGFGRREPPWLFFYDVLLNAMYEFEILNTLHFIDLRHRSEGGFVFVPAKRPLCGHFTNPPLSSLQGDSTNFPSYCSVTAQDSSGSRIHLPKIQYSSDVPSVFVNSKTSFIFPSRCEFRRFQSSNGMKSSTGGGLRSGGYWPREDPSLFQTSSQPSSVTERTKLESFGDGTHAS